MAYNEVSLPQWQQVIRRVFGLTGPGGNVPTIAPEIQPVVMLQPDLAEFRWLRKESTWAGRRGNSGGVGTVPTIGFLNPLGSNTLVVLDTLHISLIGLAAQSSVIVSLDTQTNVEGNTPGGVAGATNFSGRDSRIVQPAGSGTPAAVIRFGPVAAPAAGFGVLELVTAGTAPAYWLDVVKDIVLFPGWGITLFYNNTGAGTTLTVSFRWYERPAEQAEANG